MSPLLIILCTAVVTCYSKTAHTERVVIGQEIATNLSCYSCSTIDELSCRSNNISTEENQLIVRQECAPGEGYCSVTRVEYVSGNSEKRTFWALERGCTKDCIDGCIVLGERTKLHLCSSCCTSFLCNINNASQSLPGPAALFSLLDLLLICAVIVAK